MKVVNNIVKWFEKWLPYIWGGLVVLIVTGVLGGVLIWTIKWWVTLLGGM